MKKIAFLRRIVILFILFCIFGLGFVYYYGGMKSKTANREIGSPPENMSAESIVIHNTLGKTVHGWFFPGEKNAPVIALFHRIRSDRREMTGRARFLVRDGFNILTIDLQAHGESRGDYITYGLLESFDVKAVSAYLRKRFQGQKIGAVGVSLGGASCLLGETPADFDALVIEAVFPNINDAVKNRIGMRLGRAGRLFSFLLVYQLKLRLGVSPEELRPEDSVKNFHNPLLVIAGSDDRHTPLHESKRLFDNAHEPKELWVIEGAGHENFHSFSPKEYEEKILDFFSEHLKLDN